MWWAIGFSIWVVWFAVVLALCKATTTEDRRIEELPTKKREGERQDRAA
jgi:hypothetical protein